MPESRLTLLDWRAMNRNTLRGFAKVALPNHLVIRDIAIHNKNDSWWAQLPSKPQLQDGQPVLKDGKIQYVKILEWDDRDIGDRFSAAVVDLVRSQHRV